MPSHWSVLHYGKLLEPARDAASGARAGRFAVTGTSAGFPPELVSACTTQAAGATDQTAWAKFHWFGEQATLVLRPVHAGGRWHLQAIRLLVRGEDGGGKSGRLFPQAEFLTLPVADLTDPTDLFALPAAARAGTFTEKRTDLPPVLVGGRDQPLPRGWFDADARMMLAAVVSGYGVAVRELDTPPDAFFARALRCAACLPRAVRWRVPIGAGFNETPDGFGFAHGQGVRGKVRKVEGDWKQSDGVNLSDGQEYVAWVASEVDQAATVGDLMARVDARFRELPDPALGTWDGIADGVATVAWTDAVRILIEAVRYTEMAEVVSATEVVVAEPLPEPVIRRVAVPHTPHPPEPQQTRERFRRVLNGFRYLRRQALELLLRAARLGGGRSPARAPRRGATRKPPGAADDPDGESPLAVELLGDLTEKDWIPVWKTVAAGTGSTAPMAGALGGLLGAIPLQPFALVEAAAAVPPGLVPNAAGRLALAFQRRTRGAERDWAPLIRAAGGSAAPPVLCEWRAALGNELLWVGIGVEIEEPATGVISSWAAVPGEPAATRAARTVLAGGLTSFPEWAALCRSIDLKFALVASRWAERLLAAGRVAEASLLIAAVSRNDGPTPARVPAAFTARHPIPPDAGAGAVALADAVREQGPVPVLLYSLAVLHDHLNEADRRQVQTRVESIVSPLFGALAFGYPSAGQKLVRALTAAEGEVLPLLPARDATRFPPGAPPSPVVEVVLAVYRGHELNPLPELTADEAEQVAGALAGRVRGGPPPHAVNSIGQLRTFAALSGSDLYYHEAQFDRFWPELLAGCAADPTEARFWETCLGSARLADKPLFRLLAGKTRPVLQPTSREEELLLRLAPDDAFVARVQSLEGWSGPLLARMTAILYTSDAPTLEVVQSLAEAARESKLPALYDAVIRAAVRRRDAEKVARVGSGVWAGVVRDLLTSAGKVFERQTVLAWSVLASEFAPGPSADVPVCLRVKRRAGQ